MWGWPIQIVGEFPTHSYHPAAIMAVFMGILAIVPGSRGDSLV